MKFHRGKPLLELLAAALLVLICVVAARLTLGATGDGPPWYGILPPLVAIVLAFATQRIFLSLGTAVVLGGLLSVLREPGAPLAMVAKAAGATFVFDSLNDADKQGILLYVVLVMAMIAVMLVAGGLQGVAAWLMRFARSTRSTKLVTFAAGLVIFIDDYANTMIVGSALRPVTDRQRISREKLAFLVDATAAPIAGIAVISTWIGMEVGLLSDVARELHVGKGGYTIFFDALGFRFYCLGMIAFVFFNAVSNVDFGPMARAERRALAEGKLLADGARPMTSRSLTAAEAHPEARIRASVAVVPMLVLLGVFLYGIWADGDGLVALWLDPRAVLHFSAWRDTLKGADSIPILAYASATGLLVAMLAALVAARVRASVLPGAIWTGIKSSLIPIGVLVLAWSLKGACDALDTGEFLAGALGDRIPPPLFPALVFVVASLTSFATGTSWGTMAILIPTAIPVAHELDGGVYGLITMVSVAAVLDGSIFGDHCSPISDTTIMSSAASSCDHLAHVRTQMPYSLVVAVFALTAGYLPSGAGASKWVGILGGAGLSALLFLGLWLFRSRARPHQQTG